MIQRLVTLLIKAGLDPHTAERTARSIDNLYKDQKASAIREYWKIKKRESKSRNAKR